MSETIRTGGCACGRVRFECEGVARFVAHCWCANCRQAHGAAFVTWAGYPAGHFRIVEGELQQWRTPTDATRSFCGTCGTTLLFQSPRWEGETHVVVTALDEGPDRPPQANAHADRAPEWCPVDNDLPRYGGEDGSTELP